MAKDEVKTEKIIVKTGRSGYDRKISREGVLKQELSKLEHAHLNIVKALQEKARRAQRDALYKSLSDCQVNHDRKNKLVAGAKAELELVKREAKKEHDFAVRQLQGVYDRTINEAIHLFETTRDNLEGGVTAKNKPIQEKHAQHEDDIKSELVAEVRSVKADYEAACIPLLQELGQIEAEQKAKHEKSVAKAPEATVAEAT